MKLRPLKAILSGKTATVPVDEEVAERFAMYQFMKAFNCGPAEYEALPFKESQWLLQLDRIYHEAEHDISERANKQ